MGSNASSPTTPARRQIGGARWTHALAALAASGLAVSGFAAASAAPPPPVTAVSYADLDLSQPGDAKLMLKRLNKAATAVCGGDPHASAVLPRMVAWQKKCVGDAIDRSLAAIDAPLVAQLHAGETPVAASLAAR